MIRLSDISMPLDYTDEQLRHSAAKALKVSDDCILNISLFRRSIDARKKDNVHFNCTVEVNVGKDENKILKNCHNKKASQVEAYKYVLPPCKPLLHRPLVVGFGPSGIFSALILAQLGYRPIVIERGRDVDNRTLDVNKFWGGNPLDEVSNVQFGEGGAGTFSDGKLNTGTKDVRSRKVLQEFVENGAPNEILYMAKPHIGTDKLKVTIKNLRKKIISLGGEIRFENKLVNILCQNGTVTGAKIAANGGEYEIETDNIILAIGHSARDTFDMLFKNSISMAAKPFSVGARIEHSQDMINVSQYGKFAGHPRLGAADYKLAVHLPNGRGVYTFCMCPGGTVVAAASERGRVVTNGMSEFARDKKNANSALLVGVNPTDFGSSHPLAGVEFQRKLEENAFILGGSNYNAPVQLVGDFLKNRTSNKLGAIEPSYKPGYRLCNLDQCLPSYITESMKLGILEMDKRLKGFASPEAVLTAVETRSSSPVRIIRDDSLQSTNLRGLYPCGEGAGYAGGIISAAVDGIRCAEALASSTL